MATSTPFPLKYGDASCSKFTQEAVFAWSTAKNSLFGFSMYSICGSALMYGIRLSFTVRIAYSLRISSTAAPSSRAASRLPEYFTISSQVCSSGL